MRPVIPAWTKSASQNRFEREGRLCLKMRPVIPAWTKPATQNRLKEKEGKYNFKIWSGSPSPQGVFIQAALYTVQELH
jgi:hypothetical protein